MKIQKLLPQALKGLAALALTSAWLTAAATEPCGDFGECKVLIEINSTDGDIGFHFLGDGDELVKMEITDPDGQKVFTDKAKGPLREQTMTETFLESAEPLCWNDPEADEDEDIVTLEDFVDLWTPGLYVFSGLGAEGEMAFGSTMLTFVLPPAPAEVEFELEEEDEGEYEGEISWSFGDDLGNCTPAGAYPDGVELAGPGDIKLWEVVVEPDYDDEEEPGLAAMYNSLTHVVRIPGGAAEFEVEIPDDYLGNFPANTPLKVEVGAITWDDNATFTEIGDLCVTPDGCEDDD
ncbi:MAG: hypothetical protein R3176_01015 [Woeseiaceae bacterium]|nr:hypothetical protein [Woeseiaceae bacterium]